MKVGAVIRDGSIYHGLGDEDVREALVEARGMVRLSLDEGLSHDDRRFAAGEALEEIEAATWLLDALRREDGEGPAAQVRGPASPTEARGPCAVELRGPLEPLLVLGVPVGPIRASEYKVLQALWEAYQDWRAGKGERKLSYSQFDADPSAALTPLCKRLPVFDRVLRRPGDKKKMGRAWRAGYWLRSADEAHPS